jgi:hypothetical protein
MPGRVGGQLVAPCRLASLRFIWNASDVGAPPTGTCANQRACTVQGTQLASDRTSRVHSSFARACTRARLGEGLGRRVERPCRKRAALELRDS